MKKFAILCTSLLLSMIVAFSAVNVFASNEITPYIDSESGSDTYSKDTRRNEYDYSALFQSTIHYNGYRWVATNQYGTTTLFNQSRSYGASADCMVLSFNYSGMGQSGDGYFTQVNSSMYHYY